MKKLILIMIMLIFVNMVLAQDIEVVKQSVSETRINDVIEISINIKNSYSTEKEFLIEEILPQDIQVIEPAEFSIRKNDALEVRYYEWITKISPNSIKTIIYKIRPLSLGQYSLGSTEVTDKSNSKTYSSNTLTFNVKCVANNKCEANENANDCPEDCSAGEKDGICDYKADGICDKDCTEEPDCRKSNFKITYITIPLGVIIILVILFIIVKGILKKKKNQQEKGEITQNMKNNENNNQNIANNYNNHDTRRDYNDQEDKNPLKGL